MLLGIAPNQGQRDLLKMKALDLGYINIFPMGRMRYNDHAMV